MDLMLDQQGLLFGGIALIAAVAIIFILLAMRANSRMVGDLRGRLQTSEGELQELRPLREEAAVLRSNVARLKEAEDQNRDLSASLSEREAAYSAVAGGKSQDRGSGRVAESRDCAASRPNSTLPKPNGPKPR